MSLIYEKFVHIKEAPDGSVEEISFNPPDSYNFAYDVMDALAEKTPDKNALVWVSIDGENRNFTFKELREYSNRAANLFASRGIKKGDKVMLVLRRHYQFWFALLGLHKLGAIGIPATDQLMKKDYVYRFDAAGVSGVVATSFGEATNHIDEALPESPSVRMKLCANGKTEGWDNFDELLEQQPAEFTRPEGLCIDDPILMYFTSGTTGYPKIVTHSNRYSLGHVTTAKYWHNVTPDGLHLTISDTGWAKSAWGKLYGQWLCETAVFAYDFERFNADDILKKIGQYKVTTFCAPPTMFRFFIQEDLSKYDLSSLKHCSIAGEALNPEVFNRFYKATGHKLMEGFGQTEMTLLICNMVGTEPKPGSMGKPLPQYDVDIVDGDGNSCRPGEVGEIVVRTDKEVPCGLFQGYYQNPELTYEVWHDGLYHTGDMAWRDEDGYYWYMSRTDDVIKSSGYRIGPFEIESVLMEHPAVMECAVTGVPDELRGQAVKATIVLARGYEPSEELKREIQNHVKEMTAPYKYPRVIEFMTELPKTISGKIRRVELRGEEK